LGELSSDNDTPFMPIIVKLELNLQKIPLNGPTPAATALADVLTDTFIALKAFTVGA
jgi:hypothetical protein